MHLPPAFLFCQQWQSTRTSIPAEEKGASVSDNRDCGVLRRTGSSTLPSLPGGWVFKTLEMHLPPAFLFCQQWQSTRTSIPAEEKGASVSNKGVVLKWFLVQFKVYSVIKDETHGAGYSLEGGACMGIIRGQYSQLFWLRPQHGSFACMHMGQSSLQFSLQ